LQHPESPHYGTRYRYVFVQGYCQVPVLFQLWFFSFSYSCDLSVTVSVTVM